MNAAFEISSDIGKKAACEAFGVPRASFYRNFSNNNNKNESIPKRPPLALSQDEKERALEILHSEKFQDKAPYQVYAGLLDEGI